MFPCKSGFWSCDSGDDVRNDAGFEKNHRAENDEHHWHEPAFDSFEGFGDLLVGAEKPAATHQRPTQIMKTAVWAGASGSEQPHTAESA